EFEARESTDTAEPILVAWPGPDANGPRCRPPASGCGGSARELRRDRRSVPTNGAHRMPRRRRLVGCAARPFRRSSAAGRRRRSSERLLALATNRYAAGVAAYLEVITAQAGTLANRHTAVVILTRRMIASALLIKGIGGRWQG